MIGVRSMLQKYWVFFFVAVSLYLIPQTCLLAGLEPGHPAKPPKITKWLGGDPLSGMDDDRKNPVVMLFWSPAIVGSKPALRLLSSMVNVYKKDGVRFATITKEPEKLVADFLSKNPDLTVCVGLDDAGRAFKEYMGVETGMPYVFVIDGNGKLAWRGRVAELARVIPLVLSGTFEYTKQRQIEDLHRELEISAQYMDKQKESSIADKILAIDPSDRQAVEARTRIMAQDGDIDGAIKLVAEARGGAVGNRHVINSLCFIEFNVLASQMSERSRERMRSMVEEYYEQFKDDSAALDAMAITIVGGAPFELVPIDTLLKISQRGVELAEKEKDSPTLANCLRTLSRVYHLSGDLEKALSAHEKACFVISSYGGVPASMPLLAQFYKDALAVKKGAQTEASAAKQP